MATQTSVGAQVRETQALGVWPVLFAVLASVVGTVLTGFFGAGRLGTFAGAAIPPLVSAAFTTQGRGAARTIGIGVLTGVSVVLTVTGFTVTDLVRDGESPVADRDGTFWKAAASSPESKTPESNGNTSGLSVPDRVRCPDTEVDGTSECRFGLKPVGRATIRVTGAELDGDHREDFEITKECDGTLRPGTACSVRLKFTPSDEGERKAEVVVSVPDGTRVVELRGKGVRDGGNACEGTVPPEETPPASPTPCVPGN